jgi:hypothetical protein
VQGKGLSAPGRVPACPVASGQWPSGALSVALCLAVGSRQPAFLLLELYRVLAYPARHTCHALGSREPPTSRTARTRAVVPPLVPPRPPLVPPRATTPRPSVAVAGLSRAALLAASDKSLAVAAPAVGPWPGRGSGSIAARQLKPKPNDQYLGQCA